MKTIENGQTLRSGTPSLMLKVNILRRKNNF